MFMVITLNPPCSNGYYDIMNLLVSIESFFGLEVTIIRRHQIQRPASLLRIYKSSGKSGSGNSLVMCSYWVSQDHQTPNTNAHLVTSVMDLPANFLNLLHFLVRKLSRLPEGLPICHFTDIARVA